MIPLSAGALADITNGADIQKPIFQILGTKRLNSADSERYRVLLSDGVTSTSFTMLATQLNSMITSNELSENSIIEVTRYALSNANIGGKPRKVMVILGIEIKVPGDRVNGKIGNPIPDKSSGAGDQTGTGAGPATQGNKRAATVEPVAGGAKKRLNDSVNAGADIVTTPIAALSPYQNRWVVKARVTHKGDVRSWTNSRGEGKVWNMTLVDESGEIRCTGFTDSVDRFYNMIEVGNVYYISRAQLKVANKQFNNTNNDYEMTLTGDSEIILCHDDIGDVPEISYNFVQINDLANCEKGALVDILAVVKSAEPVQSLTARATGKELRKRELTLVDSSDASISLTLWGTQAETFEGDNYPIIIAKGVRVGEYQNGKNLGTTQSTLIQLDPDIPEAHRLRGWFNSVGKNQEVTSLSKGAGGLNAEWMLLEEANERALRNQENGEVCLTKATITLVRGDRALYKSCPTESCKKKVVDQSNGMFRCEKCDREFPNFKYRMLVNMSIADFSGNQWVTAFGEEAEKILGMSSQELGELSETSPDEYTDKFNAAAFNNYVFKLRLKTETYNDESKMRANVITCQPVNFKSYNKHLVAEIKKLANIHNVN